jgi:hypothetical protein
MVEDIIRSSRGNSDHARIQNLHLLRNGKLVDEGMLGDDLLLPVPLNFAQVPRCGDIAAAQVIRLSRGQIQDRCCGEGDRVQSGDRAGRLNIEFRGNDPWVDRKYPDAWILCKR